MNIPHFSVVQLFEHVHGVALNAPAVTVVAIEHVARAHAAVVAIVDTPVATHQYFANAFVAVSSIGLIHGVVGSTKIATIFPGIAQPFAFHGAHQTKYAEIARLLISQFPSWLIKCTKKW